MDEIKISQLRALVVDDSMIWRKQLQQMLRQCGFELLDEAENAAAAADKMEAQRFDIVFLDWLMPVKSGISLLEQWRDDARYDAVAVIVISSEGERRMINSALKAGAGYIIKPGSHEALQEHVAKAIKWINHKRGAANQTGK
jgi:two-component system chemotaxis response regulator CheY